MPSSGWSTRRGLSRRREENWACWRSTKTMVRQQRRAEKSVCTLHVGPQHRPGGALGHLFLCHLTSQPASVRIELSLELFAPRTAVCWIKHLMDRQHCCLQCCEPQPAVYYLTPVQSIREAAGIHRCEQISPYHIGGKLVGHVDRPAAAPRAVFHPPQCGDSGALPLYVDTWTNSVKGSCLHIWTPRRARQPLTRVE